MRVLINKFMEHVLLRFMVNLIKLTLRDLETNLIKDHHFFEKK